MTAPKTWGLFSADGQLVATGDDWRNWNCQRKEYEPKGYEHTITGEWVDEGFAALPCPFEAVATKLDRCSRCGMEFRYP
jgi:hypothetical protein